LAWTDHTGDLFLSVGAETVDPDPARVDQVELPLAVASPVHGFALLISPIKGDRADLVQLLGSEGGEDRHDFHAVSFAVMNVVVIHGCSISFLGGRVLRESRGSATRGGGASFLSSVAQETHGVDDHEQYRDLMDEHPEGKVHGLHEDPGQE